MTPLQHETMAAVRAVHPAWFRARRKGERVTLANLYRAGALDRRAWRGVEGDADAAHEYRIKEPT